MAQLSPERVRPATVFEEHGLSAIALSQLVYVSFVTWSNSSLSGAYLLWCVRVRCVCTVPGSITGYGIAELLLLSSLFGPPWRVSFWCVDLDFTVL